MKRLTPALFMAAMLFGIVASGSINSTSKSKSDEASLPRPNVPAVEKERAQIIEAVHQFNEAAIRNDIDMMSRMLADEYATSNDNGAIATKAEVLRLQRDKTIQFFSVTTHDVEVQTNGDFAVEKDVSDVKGTWHGRPFSGSFASTRTLQKRNGEWKMLAFEVHDQK